MEFFLLWCWYFWLNEDIFGHYFFRHSFCPFLILHLFWDSYCVPSGILFKNVISLFVWVPSLGRVSGIFDLHCGMQDLSCSVGTLSCGVWGLILRPGIASRPPALGAQRPSLWTSREVPILIFLMVSQRSLGLYHFHSIFFSLFLNWIILLDLSSNLPILPSQICYWNPLVNFSFQLLIFFDMKNFCLILIISSLYILIFSLCWAVVP